MNRSRALLFDTQAVVFWATGKIPVAVIRRVTQGCSVYVSVVSPWEFLLKTAKNTPASRSQSSIDAFGIDYQKFLNTIKALQAVILPIELSHLEIFCTLPFRKQHRDPFDRLLIAQAMKEHLILVGGDEEFPAYPIPVLWHEFSKGPS